MDHREGSRPRHRIDTLFSAAAARWPHAPAVHFQGAELTYGELERRSSLLAGYLQRLGVRPEDRVALLVERSLEMVVGLLGVLRAGGAYVALDPADQPGRVRGMLDDCGAEVLLTLDGLARRAASLPARHVVLDRDWPGIERAGAAARPVPTGPDSLAYVAYTSGSTGVPKAVGATHRGVTRVVRDPTYATFGPDDVFLQLAPLAFDASTLEIWDPLLNGGLLVVLPPQPVSLDELASTLTEKKITTLWLTSGLFTRMAEAHLPALGGLRQVIAGGDVLSVEHVNRLRAAHPNLHLVNGYGPTETTTFACCFPVREPVTGPVPIGYPIGRTTVHVLDQELRPVPPGETGELYVAGDGLARGYLGQPGLTAERFLPDPYADGGRVYATGDTVGLRADGALDFRGRRDGQVKVHGYRVELAEVESALARQPDVSQGAVAVHRNSHGEAALVAYVVPSDQRPPDLPARLRRGLREELPSYMVPSTIQVVEELPLTRSGKVDRAALPDGPAQGRPMSRTRSRARPPRPCSPSCGPTRSSSTASASTTTSSSWAAARSRR